MSSQLNRAPEKLEANETTLFDRTFRDSEGKIVLAQMPNLPPGFCNPRYFVSIGAVVVGREAGNVGSMQRHPKLPALRDWVLDDAPVAISPSLKIATCSCASQTSLG